MVVIVLTEEDNELGQQILPLPRPVCVGQYNFIWKRKFIAFSAELGQQSFRQAVVRLGTHIDRPLLSAVCLLTRVWAIRAVFLESFRNPTNRRGPGRFNAIKIREEAHLPDLMTMTVGTPNQTQAFLLLLLLPMSRDTRHRSWSISGQ